MTLVAASISSAKPAGTFYDDDENENDDGSVSSDSSGSSSDSSDDDEDDDNEVEQKAPTSKQTDPEEDQQQSSSSATAFEDEIKIRQKAFDLINKAGGPSGEEDKKQWPQSPKKYHYAHQQSAGESSSYQSPYQQSSSSSAEAARQQSSHHAQAAHTADKLSVTELFVNCITDVCKVSSSEIVNQGMSILSSGYQSLSSYKDQPLNGSYDPIDTSQHGYGNNNSASSKMRGRYRD